MGNVYNHSPFMKIKTIVITTHLLGKVTNRSEFHSIQHLPAFKFIWVPKNFMVNNVKIWYPRICAKLDDWKNIWNA